MQAVLATGFTALLAVFVSGLACAPRAQAPGARAAVEPPPGGSGTSRWLFDNRQSIGGFVPTLIGSPSVRDSEHGNVLCFDGDDGVLLEHNPLQGLAAFTLEVLFRPDPVTSRALAQPRFVHVQAAEGRAMIELRVDERQFYLDTYLRLGDQGQALLDPRKTHAVGAWHWAALVYDRGRMRHFVDAVEEASAPFQLSPLGAGKTSIGVRQNLAHWFSGCVRELRVTPVALDAARLAR